MTPHVLLLLLVCALLAAAVPVFVRQRTELAQLRAHLELKADQVAALSHELRTPLSIIVGSAGVLADESSENLTPQQRRFAHSIASNAARVGTLAETLLTQARLEAGLFTLAPQQIEMRSYVRNAVAELRRVLGRDIAVDTPGPPLNLDVDAHLLRQVLDNLVLNAARADQNEGGLLVTLRNAEEVVILSIRDHGVGISDAARPRIFNRFSTTTTSGAGLGLYVCHQIIELHGGRILIDTLTGAGTSFFIVLPKRPGHRPTGPEPRLPWWRRRPVTLWRRLRPEAASPGAPSPKATTRRGEPAGPEAPRA